MTRRYIYIIFLLIIVIISTSCSGTKQGVFTDRNDYENSKEIQFAEPTEGETVAVIYTDLGEIYIALFPEYAQMAVENFTALATQGYYNNIPIHRISKDFLIQSGDASLTGVGGASKWNNTPYPVEISDKLHHYSGAVGIAHVQGQANTNLSQFYIIQTEQGSVSNTVAHELLDSGMREEVADAYRTVGGAPYLDNYYTVFGHVFDGMDIVDEIAKIKTDENDAPIEPIYINSIEITEYTKGMSIQEETED